MKIEPPPLPSTLPPASRRITTTQLMNAPNLNNNAEESWHENSSNNNGENILSNDVTSSNNFLEEERAASSIGSGNTPKKIICIYFIFNQFYFNHKGWGSARFDVNMRPIPIHQDSSRISAGSSSESEAHSTISRDSIGNKDKEKKSGMFRLFSKKKRSN